MTIQQLRTAMEAARTGSITQAAKNLYLSQPNASSMLRTLEQELGYEIFSRTNSGIVPTEAGERFLEHAKVILAQLQELYTIRAQGRVCRLRLGVQSFSPAVEAFIRLTQQYRDCPSAEFKCVNISADGGIRALADMELDVVAALIAPCMLPAAEQAVQNQNLELHFLHQVPACLNLRRRPPAAGEAAAQRRDVRLPAARGLSLCRVPEAPHAHRRLYHHQHGRPGPLSLPDRGGRARYALPHRRHDGRVLHRCRLPQAVRARYQLECVPIPGQSMRLYCITRRGGPQNPEIARYLHLLQSELPDPPTE